MPNPSPRQPPLSRAQSDREWLRRAIALWAVLAVAISAKVLVQPEAHTVYPVFARGARNWWVDVPLYLTYQDVDLFRYSPTFALAVTPFGMLPDRLGGTLWVAASIAALLGAMRLLVREVLPGDWTARREALFLVLVLVGSARGIWSGQNNALLIAAAMLALVAIARGRWWTASFLLAAAVFIKLWPIALALLLMACWTRKLIGRFCAASAVLAAVPFLTRPPAIVCGQYAGWISMLAATQRERWTGYRDAWTIWEYFRFPVPQNLYEIVQCETALAVLAWCLWQRQRDGSVRRVLASVFSMWLAWQLVFGPGSERLTYLIIAPMTAWALLTSFAEKRLRVPATAAWLATSLLGMGEFERSLKPVLPFAPALLPLGVAVFAVWLVLHQRLSAAAALPEEPAAEFAAAPYACRIHGRAPRPPAAYGPSESRRDAGAASIFD